MEFADESKYKVLTVREAQTLALFPGSRGFMQPPREALAKLHEGHLVKVVVVAKGHAKPCAEDVVVAIQQRQGGKFIGLVWQKDLGRTMYHGLAELSRIRFKIDQIVDVIFERPEQDPKAPKSARII